MLGTVAASALAACLGGCPTDSLDQAGQPTADITQISAATYRGTLNSRSNCIDSTGTPSSSFATQNVTLQLTDDSRVLLDGQELAIGTIILSGGSRETITSVVIGRSNITVNGFLSQTGGTTGTTQRVYARTDAATLAADFSSNLSATTGTNCTIRASGSISALPAN